VASKAGGIRKTGITEKTRQAPSRVLGGFGGLQNGYVNWQKGWMKQDRNWLSNGFELETLQDQADDREGMEDVCVTVA